MPKRQTGGLLIIVGVIVALVTSAVAIAGGIAVVGVGVVACLGLLGVGVALLSVDGPIFGGTLARRGLKTLAFGLVGDFVTLGLLALPGLEGSNAMVLFIPFFVIGWATIVGAGLTVLALVVAGGRPRRVGATFLAAPVALFAAKALGNEGAGSSPSPLRSRREVQSFSAPSASRGSRLRPRKAPRCRECGERNRTRLELRVLRSWHVVFSPSSRVTRRRGT